MTDEKKSPVSRGLPEDYVAELVEHEQVDADQVADRPVEARMKDMFEDDSVDPRYRAKARLLNDAIRDIGMGKYQVPLFFI